MLFDKVIKLTRLITITCGNLEHEDLILSLHNGGLLIEALDMFLIGSLMVFVATMMVMSSHIIHVEKTTNLLNNPIRLKTLMNGN